jgi:NDP-sugar pyrophosphorylase family protein
MSAKKYAVILAGGRGTRLMPYTISTPKPMVPIDNVPILEIVIKQLKKNKFDHIVIAVNHQANIIMDYFSNGSKWGIEITYSLENEPLGTMGPLKLIENLPEDFLVMNGDILTDFNYLEFYGYHLDNKNKFTIASFSRNEIIDYGVLETTNNQLINFKEKPEKIFKVSMGIYMVNKQILNYIVKNKLFGFDDLMLNLLDKKIIVNTIMHKGYWLDIGRPSDYRQAIKDFEDKKLKKNLL